jgi:cyclase
MTDTTVHHLERREDVPDPAMVDLGGGFHAFVQLDGSWGLNNAGIFVGREDVVVIDTAFTAGRGRMLRDAVRELSDLPVRTVVNTHHHGDHVYGNYLFPGATIVSHERCREAVLADDFEVTTWFPGVEWGDLRVSPPTLTFEDSISIWCDDVRARVRYVGPAHTSNDVIVWVADRRLLYAGDLVFNGGTPFVVMGSIQGLIDTMHDLAALAPETVVPGHGPVAGPEVIQDQIAYLGFIQEVAAAGFAAGREPLEVARATDLGDFARLTDGERLVGNLHRAYSELRGEPRGVPLDYGAIVDEMVAYNGGRPLRCLA